MTGAPPICNLLVLRSPDIDRAATFYQQIGLVFTKHSHGNGPEHYASEVRGFVFELYPARDAADVTNRTRIGFTVDDSDRVVARLKELGVTVRVPPTDTRWGRRAVVQDFDGHVVELTTPANG